MEEREERHTHKKIGNLRPEIVSKISHSEILYRGFIIFGCQTFNANFGFIMVKKYLNKEHKYPEITYNVPFNNSVA